MKGRNDIYTVRWKGGMKLAQRTLPMYTQRGGREEWHLCSVHYLYIQYDRREE